MKTGFTLARAASVMLAAVMLATGCSKEAALPEEQNEFTTSVTESRTPAFPITYTVHNRSGKTIGEMDVADEKGYARVTMTVHSSVAPIADELSALILDDRGAKYAELGRFRTRDAGPFSEPHYFSITFPLVNGSTGNEITSRELIRNVGYPIVVMHKGEVVARGRIQ